MSTTSPNITDPVTIVEVSPRDGLQNESVLVYSDHKLALIGHLVTMGAKRVEVVSFVNIRFSLQCLLDRKRCKVA